VQLQFQFRVTFLTFFLRGETVSRGENILQLYMAHLYLYIDTLSSLCLFYFVCRGELQRGRIPSFVHAIDTRRCWKFCEI